MDTHVTMLNRHSLRDVWRHWRRDVWRHWRRRRRRIWGRQRRIIRSHFCHFHFSEIQHPLSFSYRHKDPNPAIS